MGSADSAIPGWKLHGFQRGAWEVAGEKEFQLVAVLDDRDSSTVDLGRRGRGGDEEGRRGEKMEEGKDSNRISPDKLLSHIIHTFILSFPSTLTACSFPSCTKIEDETTVT